MLEVIGFTIDGCLKAQAAGALRIELCDNPGEGGTTPSYGFIKIARHLLTIELFPIIRPRGGDFLYSEEEFEIMKHDLKICKSLGCDGVVIGCLTTDGNVDPDRTSKLIEMAYPMEVTFHRAFDRVKDPFQSMEELISLGCTRILTSGLRPNAIDGATLIKKLVEQADDRITIMPGSGVTSSNIIELKKTTGAKEFHSSARKKITGKMIYKNERMKETLESYTTDEEEISKMVELLKEE